MPIYQTNLWVCELCGKTESTSEEVTMWSDPVVSPPQRDPGNPETQWDVVKVTVRDAHGTATHWDHKLACPECAAKLESSAPNEK